MSKSPPSTRGQGRRRQADEKGEGSGSGVWGQIPMPPNVAIPTADITDLVT
jgi:cytochrome c551/c552